MSGKEDMIKKEIKSIEEKIKEQEKNKMKCVIKSKEYDLKMELHFKNQELKNVRS
jgi:hypothetical protein